MSNSIRRQLWLVAHRYSTVIWSTYTNTLGLDMVCMDAMARFGETGASLYAV